MYTIRDIVRLATMLAGLIAPQICLGFISSSSRLCLSYASTMPHLRLDYALASISCEHCRSSRNHPHCVPRHIIYYCVKLEKKFAETYELMKKVYGDDCMSRTQVYTWFTQFKNGREDLNGDLRPGRPEVSNRAELVEKVREIIGIDANFTARIKEMRN